MNTEFFVATVGNCDAATVNIPMQAKDRGALRSFFITPKTAFVGAVDDAIAYQKCKKPGLSVNVWVQGSLVMQASPNYK